MLWWLLTLILTTTVQCHILSNGDQLESFTVLGGTVIVKLEFLANGTPFPNCCSNANLLQQPVMAGAVVTKMDHPETRDYLLRLDFVDNIVTCHLVPFVKDPDIISSTLCPHLACPPGWNLLQDTCFLVTQDSGSWEEGRSFCHQLGGSLATISSEVQQEALSHMITGDTWIGLRYLHSKSRFGWDDGSDHRYSRWSVNGSGIPENHGQYCVEMRQGHRFLWHTADCDQRKRLLCSVQGTDITAVGQAFSKTKSSDEHIPTVSPTTTTTTTTTTSTTTTTTPTTTIPTTTTTPTTPTTTTPTTTTTPALGCENGWISFQSSCYKLFTQPLNYVAALKKCWQHGADLAIVSTKEEDFFILGLLQESTYIGLDDLAEEGIFTWQDGTPMVYSRFISGQPDNAGNLEHCVEIRKAFAFQWNDIPCNTRNHFICETRQSAVAAEAL